MPDFDDNEIVYPYISADDVSQEMEVLKLLGKRPKRSIVRAQLAGRHREALIGDFSRCENYVQVLWVDEDGLDPQIVDRLMLWASRQSEAVEELIHHFLDNPTELRLQVTLRQLRDLQVHLYTDSQNPNRKTFTALLLDTLRTKPRSLEELYEMARRELRNTRRPEATVRQTIRRLLKARRVEYTEDKTYLRACS